MYLETTGLLPTVKMRLGLKRDISTGRSLISYVFVAQMLFSTRSFLVSYVCWGRLREPYIGCRLQVILAVYQGANTMDNDFVM